MHTAKIICWARKFWQVLYIPALSKWDLWVRFYYVLPVTFRIKKTTISAFTSFSKGRFVVKKKTFLYMLLLPIYVSPFTSAHTHTSKDTALNSKLLEIWMKFNMTVENIPIPMSMISVFVFCISSKRSQHSSWLSGMKPRAVRKNS